MRLKVKSSIALFLGSLLLFSGKMYSQWGTQDVIQQEFSRTGSNKPLDEIVSPRKLNVDASGDYNLIVPLFNVAGRNEKGFDLSLLYTPGVRVTDDLTPAKYTLS